MKKKSQKHLVLNENISANWCGINPVTYLRSLEKNPDLEISKNKLQSALVKPPWLLLLKYPLENIFKVVPANVLTD